MCNAISICAEYESDDGGAHALFVSLRQCVLLGRAYVYIEEQLSACPLLSANYSFSVSIWLVSRLRNPTLLLFTISPFGQAPPSSPYRQPSQPPANKQIRTKNCHAFAIQSRQRERPAQPRHSPQLLGWTASARYLTRAPNAKYKRGVFERSRYERWSRYHCGAPSLYMQHGAVHTAFRFRHCSSRPP